jgi:hypothetical protein
MANASANRSSDTDNRRYDDAVTKGLTALCVAYDLHINTHQVWTDTASCKENGLVSLIWFSFVQFSLRLFSLVSFSLV